LQSKLTQAHLLTEQIDELKSIIVLLQAQNELLKNKLLKDSLADYKTPILRCESCNSPILQKLILRLQQLILSLLWRHN
jgi:hypothetical protein